MQTMQLSRLTKKVVRFGLTFRHYATRKRFYKQTGILRVDDRFEIILDDKRLKTPAGNLFTVSNKALALAVANEWDSQTDKIDQSSMYLTSLCYGVIDNLNELSNDSVKNRILEYLPTDTVLFQSEENGNLYELQEQKWDPVINWFCKKYNVDLKKSRDVYSINVCADTSNQVAHHLDSFSFESLYGILFATETLKSLILTMASVEKFLDIKTATFISQLEQEYQLQSWSRLKWAHDLDFYDLQARFSAAILFVHFNSNFYSEIFKKVN